MKTTKNLSILGLVALMLAGTSYATTTNSTSLENTAKSEYERVMGNRIKCFDGRKGEYFVPEDIFCTYLKNTSSLNCQNVPGLYVSKAATEEEKKLISIELKNEGYNEEQITRVHLSFEKGNIVLGMDVMETDEFRRVLQHERVHKEIHNRLNSNDRAILQKTYATIREQDSKTPIGVKYEKPIEVSNAEDFMSAIGSLAGYASHGLFDENEFWPSIVSDPKFYSKYIDLVQKISPEAYDIMLKLREKTKLNCKWEK